jgi:hypothetical protein
MIELEVYARGLRHTVMQLSNQMDLVPKVRYKIDDHHDLVYFEIEDSARVTLAQISDVLHNIGLSPRFVGQPVEALKAGSSTTRLQ